MSDVTTKAWSLVVLSLGLAGAALVALAVGSFVLIASLPLLIGWLVLTFIWLAITAITLALVDSNITAGVLILGTVMLLAATGQLGAISLVGAGIVLVLLIIARGVLRRDVNDRRVYRTVTSFGGGSRYLIYGSLVAIAATLAVPVADTVREGVVTISEGYLVTLLTPVDPLLQKVRPELSISATVDDVVTAQVGESVPKAAREVVYKQVAQQYGVESVSGEDTLASLLTKQLNDWLTRSTQAHPLLTTGVVLLAAVFVMRVFVTPLQWLLLGVIALLVLGAKATNVVTIEKRSEPVETIQL